jgi:hypothetical protein
MTARLILIGLDAADTLLVNRFMNQGSMPHLSKLKDRGVMKKLNSPFGSSDDGLWASFQYGETISEHGRYHWSIPSPNNSFEMAYKKDQGKRFFWNKIIGHHLRKAVIDVPKCSKPQTLNGIHLADWIVHGRYFDQPISFPTQLASEVVGIFGSALPSRCGYFQETLNDADITKILFNLRESISRKKAAGLHFLNAEPWDLFLIVFKEAHCGCHSLWNLIDKKHIDYDEERNLKLGEPIKSIFYNLDEAIGDLINASGIDAEIVVFSTTDMRPNGTLNQLLPKIIHKINLHLGALFCSILPYNDNYGALRINAPKKERKRIAYIISQRLKELIDAQTKKPVIGKITFPSSESRGKRKELLPDLLFAYTPNLNPHSVESLFLGIIRADAPNIRPGNHSEGGFLIGAGNKVKELAKKIKGLENFAEMVEKILK